MPIHPIELIDALAVRELTIYVRRFRCE